MTNIPALTTNPEIAEMLAALNAALRQGADVINAQASRDRAPHRPPRARRKHDPLPTPGGLTVMAATTSRVPNTVSHAHLEDADDSYRFTVDNEKHVRGSTVRDVHACAGARALQDTPGIKDAWVTKTRTFIEYEDGRIVRYKNPERLERAVRQFDGSAGLFPPGEYILLPISVGHRMGARKQWRNAGKNAPDRTNPDRNRHHSYTFR